jgi:hypothetical protein
MTRRPRQTALIAFLTAGLLVAGCSQRASKLPSAPSTPVEPVPVADSPRHVLDLLQWALTHRDSTLYHSLFTADFQFEFSATDTAGTPYRITPWSLEDEFISSKNLCSDTSAITLIFDGNLTPTHDDRGDSTFFWPTHELITANSLTLTITKNDGTAWRVTGGAKFYFVSGDSASVPSGMQADPRHWYIQRWVDMTNSGFGGITRTEILRAMPTRRITWGQIKVYYLNLP